MCDQLLRVPDLMKILRISRPQIYKLIRQNQLPAPLHIGKASVWRLSDIENFMKNLE